MRVLRHLEICNRFDPDRFLPLRLDGRRVGFVRKEVSAALAPFPDLFQLSDRAIAFAPAGPRGTALTEALGEVVGALVAKGLIQGRRSERFAITHEWGGETLFELDRGAIPFFGTRSYGVHLNGLVGTDLWVAKRAADKKVAPGKLDNLVAGGISAGYDARRTLIKEAGEECGMAASLAEHAFPVGAILYRMEVADGVRDDVLFLYDIALPADFHPVAADGECESFRLMPLGEVLERVATTDDFKFNVNLVLIDLALRRGLIGPEHPEFLDLATGLRGRLIREAGEGAHLGG